MDASKADTSQYDGIINAIDKSLGTIEFEMDGTILTANENFLNVLGYTLEEVQGKHHRMFCEESYAQSPEYKSFWEKLNQGVFDSGEYRRIGKNGKEVFIRATYNPIFDVNGKPVKIFKIATDVTDQKRWTAEFEGKINAIDKSQGTIEFNMDGTILTANKNFLNVLGYTLEEVQGKHHSMFCEESYAQSSEYKSFWEKLNRGEFDSGEYKRVGKHGREIYIRATYNPIFDWSDKPFKVLKIATDITEQKRRDREIAKQAELIMDMSTPVMQLLDRVLLLPIIGLVDSKRVQVIMETVLQKISEHRAKVIILDVQGVPAIDSSVANHIIKITKSTKLMGCNCIVTGISPEVSQALVNLGIDLGNILTQSTLDEGVYSALESLGFKLTKLKNN